MALIASILHMALMALTIIPVSIVMAVGRLFLPEKVIYYIGARWCQFSIYTLRWLCRVKWRVTGLENLPADPNARIVLLCKHQSAWETLAMNWVLQHDIVFVFKKELLQIPFFGWAIGSVDMIYIDRQARTQAMQKVVSEGRRLIDKGRWVIMFPEGTRIPRGQIGSYKSGGARVAVATQADIIPIAVTSAKCWPKGAFVKKPGTIDVVIGPVIPSAGRDHHELTHEVQTWIENQMRHIDPQAYTAEQVARQPVAQSETE